MIFFLSKCEQRVYNIVDKAGISNAPINTTQQWLVRMQQQKNKSLFFSGCTGHSPKRWYRTNHSNELAGKYQIDIEENSDTGLHVPIQIHARMVRWTCLALPIPEQDQTLNEAP